MNSIEYYIVGNGGKSYELCIGNFYINKGVMI